MEWVGVALIFPALWFMLFWFPWPLGHVYLNGMGMVAFAFMLTVASVVTVATGCDTIVVRR